MTEDTRTTQLLPTTEEPKTEHVKPELEEPIRLTARQVFDLIADMTIAQHVEIKNHWGTNRIDQAEGGNIARRQILGATMRALQSFGVTEQQCSMWYNEKADQLFNREK